MTIPEVAAARASLLPIQSVTKVGCQRQPLLELGEALPAQDQVVGAALVDSLVSRS